MSGLATKTSKLYADTRPLHPALGVEVIGFDFDRQLGEAEVREIKALFEKHLVLVFRDQPISEEQHLQFARNFGTPRASIESAYVSPRHPEILRLGNVDLQGNRMDPGSSAVKYFTIPEKWHSDGHFRDVPTYTSILHSIEIPDEGGNTLFANMVAVYVALPTDKRRFVQDQRMTHSYPVVTSDQKQLAQMTHPMVRTLPDGRQSLVFSTYAGDRIVGLPPAESDAIVAELLAFTTQARFTYTHRWRVGDTLMWYNPALMHRVEPYDRRKRRLLKRIEIAGTDVRR